MGWLLVTAQLAQGGVGTGFILPPPRSGPGSDSGGADVMPFGLRLLQRPFPERDESLRYAQAPPTAPGPAPTVVVDVEGVPAPAGTTEPGAQPPFRWTLAPLRWGGTLANEFRQFQSGDQAQRRQLVDIMQFRGATYLWQPWFAQVAGGVGLFTSKERADADPGTTAGHSSRSTSATGNGTLSLFPSSRFPFQALVDVSDSRASSELTRSDYSSTRLGVRQSYQSPRGDANYNGSLDRSTLRSGSFGRDVVDVLGAGMTQTRGDHAYDLNGNYTRNLRGRGGEGATISRLTGRHSYRPEPTLGVETLASVSASEFRLRQSNDQFTDTATRFLQLNSFATWRPEEDHPLFVTGGARMFQSSVEANGQSADTRSLSAHGAANYAVSRNLSVAGSATVTQAQSRTTDTLFTTQAGTVTYLPDVRRFGSYVYSQNVAVTVLNQTGGADASRQNLAGQVGHNLSRVYTVSDSAVVSVNAGQTLASNYDTVTAGSQTLAHNVAVTWRASPSAASTAYVGAMAVDSRTRGHNENEFQMLNGQVSGQLQIGRYQYAGANLTSQGTRAHTATQQDSPLNWNTNGNLNYQHVRAFDVAGLRYYALYSANETQYRSRLLGDVNAPRDRVSQSFEQRLLYNIGRVEVRLTVRVARIEGERNSLVFLRVARNIGNF